LLAHRTAATDHRESTSDGLRPRPEIELSE
jgi:hypothetical protein